MARFAVNQPIVTAEPRVAVDAGLTLGGHRFRLEVIDSAGRRSAPSEVIVTVQREIRPPLEPTPPIRPEPLDPRPPVRPQPVDPIGPIRPATPIVTPAPVRRRARRPKDES